MSQRAMPHVRQGNVGAKGTHCLPLSQKFVQAVRIEPHHNLAIHHGHRCGHHLQRLQLSQRRLVAGDVPLAVGHTFL
jgi:hypothetical protein